MPTTDSSENALRRSQRVRVRPSQYTGMSNTSLFGVLFLCCLFATVSFFLFLLLRTLILFFFITFLQSRTLLARTQTPTMTAERARSVRDLEARTRGRAKNAVRALTAMITLPVKMKIPMSHRPPLTILSLTPC